MQSKCIVSGHSMRPIEYTKRVPCSYHDNRCIEGSCPLNICFVPQEPFFAIGDIPSDRCLLIKDVIEDEAEDILVRIWVKNVFVDNKCVEIPPELAELIKRKAAEMSIPVSPMSGVSDE